MLLEKTDIKSMLPDELEELFTSLGEPKYRAKQVFSWLSKGVTSFEDMTNLSAALREKLQSKCYITRPELSAKQVSALDGTIKYLWQLGDGNAVETVFMSYKHGNSVCISTQVGCRMGCAFCASTLGGLVRNLEPSEMLDQILFTEKDAAAPVSNIVLMGIGEPLDNFNNVIKFLSLVNHPDGRGIGMRHISLSTCGLTETFDKLGELNLQLTLSVSLHAPDDETRSKLMPINKRHGVDELMRACDAYQKRTGRRISFEYTMIDGINDKPEHAKLLLKRAKKLGAHVNLITLNNVEERQFKPSSPKALKDFEKILIDGGANVTIRRKLGNDVDASCGQLRRKSAQQIVLED